MSPPNKVRAGDVLAALAQARCRVIARALADKRDRHAAIHRARKGIRSLRSILALAGEGLGDAVTPIDRALRSMARGLSAIRDAHVVIAVAQSLADGDEAESWQAVAAQLQVRRDALMDELLAKDPALATRRARINALARRIEQLPWGDVRRKTIVRAIEHSERRANKAGKAALRDGSARRLHHWRRRMRRLRMQLQAVGKIDGLTVPGGLPQTGDVRRLRKRTDALGRHQDLQALARLLPKVAPKDQLPRLRDRIRREKAATG